MPSDILYTYSTNIHYYNRKTQIPLARSYTYSVLGWVREKRSERNPMKS